MLRFLTAGESHGRALISILEGIPAGLTIDFDALTAELRRRQGGYGRGRRMVIESDRADAMSGVRHGVTTGAPIALMIPNKDWENWQRTMAVEHPPGAETPGVDRAAVTRPRPGHVDLRSLIAEHATETGVQKITVSSSCTRCDNDRFFSHRAGDKGRQIGVIVAQA